MTDVNVIRADLELLYQLELRILNYALSKQKEFAGKLNDKKFDEVIYALFPNKQDVFNAFSKDYDEIPPFYDINIGNYSSVALSPYRNIANLLNSTAKKDIMEKVVAEAVESFKITLLIAMAKLEDNCVEEEKIIDSIIKKYGIEFYEEGELKPGTDPEILKLYDENDRECYDYEHTNIVIYTPEGIKLSPSRSTMNGKTMDEKWPLKQGGPIKADPVTETIYSFERTVHSTYDNTTIIQADIKSSDFDVWAAEHFLIKDVEGQPGMAYFELVY